VLPAAAFVGASALNTAAIRSGIRDAPVGPLTFLAAVTVSAAVPVLAYRWSRSLPKTIGASAGAVLVSGAILFLLLLAIFAHVGDT
jgi:hypothetical protein